jgi:DNA-binding NtrC family response regulator
MKEPTTAQGSVLIIDDEASIRESLQTLLELEGFTVQTASSGEEGLAKLAEQPMDLVLLDFALPDRNGLEILHDIRDRDPELGVIMITAYGTVENAVAAMQAGATNFIQKPWDNEKLLADVRAVVGRRRAEEERHRQGTDRESDSHEFAAQGPPVRSGEHGLHARGFAGIHVVRAREGRIHQRSGVQEGPVRDCRPRHAVPG